MTDEPNPSDDLDPVRENLMFQKGYLLGLASTDRAITTDDHTVLKACATSIERLMDFLDGD